MSSEPTPLPPDRVTDCAPFEIVGIDLAGPLFLKDGRKIGEVVLVGDDNKKRLFWALAKIIELIPGRDGKIRTVRLKTLYGKILRPIQRIHSLEIRSNENLQRGLEESIPTVSETMSPDESPRWEAVAKCSEIKVPLDGVVCDVSLRADEYIQRTGWTFGGFRTFIF
ncbi:DUF5641 domain-containing protein [Trichonephila clavipes]|nr:DUF5641 domain-containing protein [Trichonephila clavipes]